MRKPLEIGNKKFKFKKDALAYYRAILNSYNFGESLNDDDFQDIINLMDYDYLNFLVDNQNVQENEIILDRPDAQKNDIAPLEIEDIKVSKVQFNTKCFEVQYSDKTSQYISYTMMVNNKRYTPEILFNVACRNSVQNDIHSIKQEYFDINSIKGKVKCQETQKLSSWTELAVDHRQPNTFSVIVDRFKEINTIDLDKIEYKSNDQNLILFRNEFLRENFRNYHKEKANLRVVRKECNLSRTGMAKIKNNSKDLKIK